MPLTEVVIRQARPDGKAIKLFDGRGLYLLPTPNGSRWWRFKYRFDGREKLLSFGIYPDVPLRLAREWPAMQEPKLAPATYAKAVWTLETLIFPRIGNYAQNSFGFLDGGIDLAYRRSLELRCNLGCRPGLEASSLASPLDKPRSWRPDIRKSLILSQPRRC